MKKQLKSAGVTNKQRQGIYKRDGYRCALCDSVDGIQIHHIVPRGKGGTDLDENLICLCRHCHSLAHGLPLKDWRDVDHDAIGVMIVEYMADHYINYGIVWNPWGNWPVGQRALGAEESAVEYALELMPSSLY